MNKLLTFFFKYKYLILSLMALLGLSLFLLPVKNDVPIEATNEDRHDNEYIIQLEYKIREIVSTIKGAGDCNVMINVSSTSESIYVKENKKSYDNDSEKTKGESEDTVLTMSDAQGNQYAIVRKKLMPTITGVIITCDGGNDNKVKSDVINAVCTVLGIGSNNVCVIAKS